MKAPCSTFPYLKDESVKKYQDTNFQIYIVSLQVLKVKKQMERNRKKKKLKAAYTG